MGKNLGLSDGEWKLMNLLWEESPRTIAQLVTALRDDTGWTKGTVFMMLSRLEGKGAVRAVPQGRGRVFYPVLAREEAAACETESFLERVYGGSLGLLVSSMAGQKALSKDDIDELLAILKNAERGAEK